VDQNTRNNVFQDLQLHQMGVTARFVPKALQDSSHLFLVTCHGKLFDTGEQNGASM
jgi:hypothetical protein